MNVLGVDTHTHTHIVEKQFHETSHSGLSHTWFKKGNKLLTGTRKFVPTILIINVIKFYTDIFTL